MTPLGVRRPTTTLVLLAITLAACSHSDGAFADGESAARVGLEVVDPRGKAELLFSHAIPDDVKRMFLQIRREARAVDPVLLPSDAVSIDQFTMEENRAVFRAQRGPVQAAERGQIGAACGTTYRIELEKAGGVWRATKTTLTVC